MRALLLTSLLWSLVALCSCLRSPTGDCGVDADCFAGESCEAGSCTPTTTATTNSNPESCDLTACETEWTGDITCRRGECVVLSCANGADLCADGCCPVEQPPDGPVLVDVGDVRFADAEIDERGYPEVMWLEGDGTQLRSTRWTGRGWETDRVTVLPEPSVAFDLEYDDGVRTLTYIEPFGALWHARQEEDASWTSTLIMESPEEIDLSDPRFFFSISYAGRGNQRVVCALHGNAAKAETEGVIPDLYVARWGNGAWDAELFEGERSVLHQGCSVGIDSLGQPHLAYGVVDGSALVQHAVVPNVATDWVRDDDPTRIGVLTSTEALQIRDDRVHIFVSATERDDQDVLRAAIYDYIRASDGTWSEQRLLMLDDDRDVGVFDAGIADDRIELMLGVVDPAGGVALGGRMFSAQEGTWGVLELFDEIGNIGELEGAVGVDRLHIFTQPPSQTRQLNYFSVEAP